MLQVELMQFGRTEFAIFLLAQPPPLSFCLNGRFSHFVCPWRRAEFGEIVTTFMRGLATYMRNDDSNGGDLCGAGHGGMFERRGKQADHYLSRGIRRLGGRGRCRWWSGRRNDERRRD
jgi:hypothetical protein